MAKRDPLSLDDTTRAWLAAGLHRTRSWLRRNDSRLGPAIPCILANGDDRGWIPQGLGYDPARGHLLQGYDIHRGGAGLTVLEADSGRLVAEVLLGEHPGAEPDRDGRRAPGHAGGVTLHEDRVYVTDRHRLYTYALDVVHRAAPGDVVPQSEPVREIDGGSYVTSAEGCLYSGDFGTDTLVVYEPGPDGGWTRRDTWSTPARAQGVVVRPTELVFSTSYGRHQRHGSLVVQDRRTGERATPYHLPPMAEGIVEIGPHIVTSYESGAEKYADAIRRAWNWRRFRVTERPLWPMPRYTLTPLTDLGLVRP